MALTLASEFGPGLMAVTYNDNRHQSPYRLMQTKASIYSDGNPQIIKLFEQARHPAKVMCVALDYAKTQHTALICNGHGDLTLTGAIDEKVVRPGPFGEGFAQESFPGICEAGRSRIIRGEPVQVRFDGCIQGQAVVNV